MIFFPPLFEDELFYSGMARYHRISENGSPRASMIQMFGSPNVCAATLFPSHLKEFCRRLPVPNTYNADELIQNHSFIPYYSPFIPQERSEKVKQIMINRSGTSIYMALGIPASEIRRSPYLKFCKECVIDDEEKFGEAYWHRSHQADGVSVCHKHGFILNDSNIEVNARHKHDMVTLSSYLKQCNSSYDTVPKVIEYLDHKLFVAQQSYQLLLNSNIPAFGLENIKRYYVFKLQEKGMATSGGRIRWLELLPRFNSHYGRDFLASLNSYVQFGNEDTWLHKLLRFPRVSCHPLRHILVLGFLDETVSSLKANINHRMSREVRQSKKNLDANHVSVSIPKKRVDWASRDAEIAKKVRLVAGDIGTEDSKLTRITKTEIGRRLKIQRLLSRSIQRLPRTHKVLNEVTESTEQFQIRRIKKVVRELSLRQMNVQSWEVKRVSGLKEKFWAKYENLIAREIQLNKL